MAMLKKQVIVYGDIGVQVDITTWDRGDRLVATERKRLIEFLTDKIMLAIHDAPFVGASLSQIKVKRVRA